MRLLLHLYPHIAFGIKIHINVFLTHHAISIMMEKQRKAFFCYSIVCDRSTSQHNNHKANTQQASYGFFLYKLISQKKAKKQTMNDSVDGNTMRKCYIMRIIPHCILPNCSQTNKTSSIHKKILYRLPFTFST